MTRPGIHSTRGNCVPDAGDDAVSLMAVSMFGKNGKSSVASAPQVHNHLAKHRPKILRTLAERKFRLTVYPSEADSVQRQETIPQLFFIMTFIGYSELAGCDERYPELTYEKRGAFGEWQWTADQFCLEIDLQIGDIECKY
ncbi:hypothetical protein B0I35DRAFT_414086 [Stachybotrys elegans]|uniref:Uncharacterized protein n=1 Tax=Stachybotrys elegans TaxID=80388 RepID=A0A8K0WLD5_9HYPO|nr:hypothetical protein B0I35DRAFT_414086 [Stachybotrys elegans]